MLCCSIGVFLLSQLYAGLIGLRALFFGQRDDLDGLIGQAAGRPSRGLSVAYAVNDTAAAHAADWIPIMSSLCSSVAR